MQSGKYGIFSLWDRIRKDLYGAGFFAVSLVFLAFASYVNYWSGLFPGIELISIAVTLLFFIYSVAFLSDRKEYKTKSRIVMKISFLLLLVAVAPFPFLAGGGINFYLILDFLYTVGPVIAYMIAFVFFLSLVALGVFLLKKGYKQGYLLVAAAFLFFILPYYTVLTSRKVVMSDETFIGFADSGLMLHGINPYANSVSGILLSNYTIGVVNSVTYTMSNKVVGILNYPDIFIFASLPFYYISEAVGSGFVLATKLQIGVFLFILLLVVARYISVDSYKKPLIGLSLMLALLLGTISAPFELLMLAMIILAYVKLESRYSWVLLGVCLAMQELLWLPVILLVVYKAMDTGIKKGILSGIGCVLVFLALNAYFIAIGPAAFVHGILNPVGNIIPDSGGVFGYLAEVVYGAGASLSGIMMGIISLFSVAIFVYIKDKRLIPVLSLLPLEFLSHNLLYYPAFFVAFLFAVLALREKRPKHMNVSCSLKRKEFLIAAMVFLLAVGISVLLYYHVQYMGQFGMQAVSFSYSMNANNTTASYRALLKGSCRTSCGSLSVLLFGFGKDGPGFFNVASRQGLGYGISNYSAVNSAYDASAAVGLQTAGGIYAAQILVYNNKYAYFTEDFGHTLG